MKECYHIIWNTFGIYPVWDERGDWEDLGRVYRLLIDNAIDLKFERDLPDSYQNEKRFNLHIEFDKEQKEFLTTQIKDLTKENGDRVCGQLDVLYLSIENSHIELVVIEEEHILKKKIARLKSRSATLLSFKYPSIFKGKNTWSKGVWITQIKNDPNKAVEIIKAASAQAVD